MFLIFKFISGRLGNVYVEEIAGNGFYNSCILKTNQFVPNYFTHK